LSVLIYISGQSNFYGALFKNVHRDSDDITLKMNEIENCEYRSVIKFLIRLGKTNENIQEQLRQAYGNNCPHKATIYRWINEFKRGRSQVHDSERSGRPVDATTEEMVKRVDNLIKSDRRISIEGIEAQLPISHGTICSIIHDHLGYSKICSRFVPKLLTPEMRENRLAASEENLRLFHRHGRGWLSRIVTEDETPLALYNPESKRESMQWHKKGEPTPLKVKAETVHRKCLMLSVFWSRNGIIKVDFADNETKITGEYYANLIHETHAELQQKFPRTRWLFLQDNAPVHKSHVVGNVINEVGWQTLNHPPYSPDLAPSDFALFKELKAHLREIKHFADADELKNCVNDFIFNLKNEFFTKSFDDLVSRWEKCVYVEGSYVEKL